MSGVAVSDGAAAEFDPAAVPLYPMLRAEVRDTDSGEFVGVVDDEIVARGLDLEPVREAIIATAAAAAARRLGDVKAIRVRVESGGAVFATVVDATGTVYDLSDLDQKTSSAGSGRKTGRAAKKPNLATPDPEGSDGFRFHPMLLVILGFPILMICFFSWILFFRGGEPAAAPRPPAARQLPVVAPAGYDPVAAWAVKIGQASGTTTGGVAADEKRVYAATGAGDRVTAYAAVEGVKQWSVDLGGTLTAGPTLTTVDGETVVAAATSSKLVALSPSSGEEVGKWKLDQASAGQVRITATGPVVIGRSNTAQIVVDEDLVTRVMPAGALPVAPGPDGSLIAVTRDRVYTSVSDKVSGDGEAIATAPSGATVSVAGWTGELLVLTYVTPASSDGLAGTQLVGLQASGSGAWRRVWASEIPTSSNVTGSVDAQLPLKAGPAGQWGIYGTNVIDLATGKVVELGEWSTVSVGDDIAFGVTSAEVLSAGRAGLGGRSEAASSSLQVVAPQAVHGSSAFLVTAGGSTEAWLYALVPASAGGDDR